MTRKFCPACALKHIAQARALMMETRKGYPTHVAFAMGHMAEAEDELVDRMPRTLEEIRKERLKLQADPLGYMPDWEFLTRLIAVDGMLPGSELEEQ